MHSMAPLKTCVYVLTLNGVLEHILMIFLNSASSNYVILSLFCKSAELFSRFRAVFLLLFVFIIYVYVYICVLLF